MKLNAKTENFELLRAKSLGFRTLSRGIVIALVLTSFGISMSGCSGFLGAFKKDFDRNDIPDDQDDEPSSPSEHGESTYLRGTKRQPPPKLDEPENEFGERIPPLSYDPPMRRNYQGEKRATRDDFIDQSQDEGSLWASNGQTNYYFTKNKVRNPGDIITLSIEDDLYRDMVSEAKRTLTLREKALEMKNHEDQLRYDLEHSSHQRDTIKSSAASPAKTPQPTPSSTAGPAADSSHPSTEELARRLAKLTYQDVDLKPALALKSGDTMVGEILERYPNGNYKVRAMKRVSYRRGPPRLISVIGIVKASDISEDTDILKSDKMYEYRVEVAH